MGKFTKIVLFVMFFAINGLSNIANAQSVQAYSDAAIDGRGFSYNVQLSITPIENNEVTHAGGWIVKLISVNPDSKGYYHKGKTNRYFSCSELGSICNPSKFDMVLVKVKYQCENNAEKLIVFYGIDREETIVVRQKPNTKCSIELESVKVRNNTDEPIYRKRIKEIEYPQQNTSTTNSNIPSSSSSNPVTQSGSSSEVYIDGQGTPKSASTGTTAQTTTSNVSETKANPVQIPDDYKGNPLDYNKANTGSNAVDDFNKGYQQGQQISDAITPLGNALVDAWNRKVDRENAHALSTRSIDNRRRDDYSILQTDLNAKLNDNSYFTQTVIQKIPSLLNTNSPTWESLLNSKELALTFGKDYLYTTENFTQRTGSTFSIKKEIRLDILDTKNYYRKNYVIPRFNGFTASYRYKYTYVLNGVSYPWKAGFQGQGIQHEFDFIYNENNIVIGIKLKILTGYYTYTPSFPIEEYYKDIFSKVGLNYLLLDANTILLKDKLIIINYESIEMYDLNVLNDQYLVNWGNYSTSPNFKKLGVGFKKLSEKSVKENYSDKYLKYVFYSTNDKGVIIGSLVKDGLAEKAGLKVDDIISNINGIPVTSPYILQLIVQAPTIDNKLQITYLRNGIEYKTIINTIKPYISEPQTVVKVVDQIKVFELLSPNGDDKNETFFIENLEKFPENEILIYNKWGEKVFHCNSYKNDWNGGNLPAGSYLYIVKIMDKTFKGSLIIHR